MTAIGDLGREGHSPSQPLTVTGPDGNGTVTTTVDTTGIAAGTYTVTITGRLLTQTITFRVKNASFG